MIFLGRLPHELVISGWVRRRITTLPGAMAGRRARDLARRGVPRLAGIEQVPREGSPACTHRGDACPSAGRKQ
jgi:hypothetical protein